MQLSIPLLVFTVLCLGACFYLSVVIRQAYVHSLTSVEEKSAGIIHFYRARLRVLLSGAPDRMSILCGLHYLTVHLIPLVAGLSFYLKTDANFLVVILSIVWNMQLFQRVFPGDSDAEDQT